MTFSYNPLWKQLIDRNMTKEDLRKQIEVSSATMAKMGKGEHVSLDVLHKICSLFECQPGAVIEYIPKEKHSTE